MKDLSHDTALKLLSSYLSLLPSRWQLQQSYVAIYITLLASLLAAAISATALAPASQMRPLLMMGPVAIAAIAQYACVTIERQSKHVRELIVFIAKLEFTLGLYAQPDTSRLIGLPWPQALSYLPPRWVSARMNSGATSDAFIDAPPDGSMRAAHRVFRLFQAFAGAILLVQVIQTVHAQA